MRIVIQRVKKASVVVGDDCVGAIQKGILLFLGIKKGDTQQDADYLINKVLQLRMFEDQNKKMNLSVEDIQGEILVVSQFTLYGNCNKGRRPSFDQAGSPQQAEELYNYYVSQLRDKNITVATGKFRAMMDVSILNDGPVTFIIESK